MTGVGPVIKGTTVEQFDVEVLGVLPDYIFLGVDIIVMRMTGPAGLVETTGGAVAGMSGSPVYLNGKLGPLAWAVAEDRRIFGVTAAEDMVGIFGFEDAAGAAAAANEVPSRVALSPKVIQAARLRLDAHRFRGARVATGAARRLGAGRDPARGHRAGLRGPRHAGFGVPLRVGPSPRAPSRSTRRPSRPERVWASPCPTATSPTTGSAPRPPSAATWRSGSATRCSTTRPARSRSG